MNELLSALIMICGASAYNGNGSLSVYRCPYNYRCEIEAKHNEVTIKCKKKIKDVDIKSN